MTKTFMTLQDAINLRDSEINRLKTGYDAAIFRRFLRRFIRVDRAVQDFLNDMDGETDNLRSIMDLLKDALDECGVERFNPEIGEDYRAKGDEIADNPKEVPTTNPGQDFQVAEIVESGYRLRGADKSQQIIVPAKVRVYRHRN